MTKNKVIKNKKFPKISNPLIFRFFRLIDAFAKADDEREFYLDTLEGFIIYADLDKTEEELARLEEELTLHPERYCPIPKLTFYEQKKIMEGFVHEKIYDIDTKEKLIDIIQSQNPRENFLEFLLDHLGPLEKWQQFYQERFRIRIIEWLRSHKLKFVFEEDLELGKLLVEKVKHHQFQEKAPKEVLSGRKSLEAKAHSYYSSEALNPRPKRGRPPKQSPKVENDPQLTGELYSQVPSGIYTFLYTPEITSFQQITFSSTFSTHEELMTSYRSQERASNTIERLEALSMKLASMQNISGQFHQSDDLDQEDELKIRPSPKNSDIKEEEGKAQHSIKKAMPLPKTPKDPSRSKTEKPERKKTVSKKSKVVKKAEKPTSTARKKPRRLIRKKT
jgi:hypothetical protein